MEKTLTCGCTESISDYSPYVVVQKMCEKHQRKKQIQQLERRIADLKRDWRAATERYQKEKQEYIERLEYLKTN